MHLSPSHLAAVAALTAVAAPLSAQSVVGRSETVFTASERLADQGWVRIGSPNGPIRVVAGQGSSVEIRAEKRVNRGSEEDVGFVIRRSRDGITVCAVYESADECGEEGSYNSRDLPRGWWDRHQVSVAFTISVPRGARIKVGTGNGAVAVEGVGGEVIANTGNGRVDVTGTSGPVKAATGNGRVLVDGTEGPVDVNTGNGDVEVTSVLGEVSAHTGNGSIEVAIGRTDPPADLDLTTGSGSITIVAPDDFGAQIRTSTGNGRIRTDFDIETRDRLDRGRIRGTIGNGRGRIHATSGNGNVTIRRKP